MLSRRKRRKLHGRKGRDETVFSLGILWDVARRFEAFRGECFGTFFGNRGKKGVGVECGRGVD